MRILYVGDIMKKTYKVRIVLALWIVVLSLAAFEAAYLITRNYYEKEEADFTKNESVSNESADGQAVLEASNAPLFILVAEDGFVVVQYYQGREEYDKTDICVLDLPVRLQEEIEGGIPIKNFNELYDFLENYSS